MNLHGKRDVFLEGAIAQDFQEQNLEMEADKLATDVLVSPDALEQFLKLGQRSKAAIEQFAAKIGIAPSIVVGRLQHDMFYLKVTAMLSNSDLNGQSKEVFHG